ncbi:YncE family protein [Rhodococcus sp. USK10]|uniref:YncE family protein n=1 Tax=Rhodococcus sp. USK10 TaxID=2789739 RepID=UPI001C604395|nr:YncE family protein [Rhodococcus sp. USK10]QYB02646.1 YncE family protein [Rhodococcus sp. USK10]
MSLHRTRRQNLKVRWALPALVSVAVLAVGCSKPVPPGTGPLPLQPVGEIALPGNGSRFDYESLDPERGLLFIAHLGASEVIELDIHTRQVVRTIPNIAQVHGVLVVPELRRVYATATGDNQLVVLDEDTGADLARGPTGSYPDGIAYDPKRGAVWTTNESGGSESVLDAATAAVRGTVDLGGDVGNVAYDPVADQMLVAVQGRDDLAAIDPQILTITRRLPMPGCRGAHGLALDPVARLAFVACENNATLITVDLNGWQPTGAASVGAGPDVLAYDQGAHRLYVAAESGTLTVFDQQDRHLAEIGSGHLADNAHVVMVDPGTHRSYYPVPSGADGRPALLEQGPAP